MSETATGTVTNPTDPTPTAIATPPAADPAPAVATPAPAAATLLGDATPAEGDPKPPAAADPKPVEPAKPDGAPEKYEFKSPEGVEYDPQVLETFSTAAKDANLSQEAAQKLVDSMVPALAQRQREQVDAIHKGWLEASKTDAEFGGDKLKENLAIAKRGYEFATPELRELLEKTHLGDHPEVVRLFLKVGKAISEDKFVAGAPGGGKPPVAAATVLYDKTVGKE